MTDPTHNQADESGCGCSQCQPELMDAPPADDPQARIEQLEEQKKALVTLWNIEASLVRIEPGNVLAIGNVDYNHGIDIGETLGNFREAMGASAVWLFTGDIDVESIRIAEREHCAALEGQLAAARKRIDELEDAAVDAVFSDVFAERDDARQQVQVLQDRIAKAAQILRDCAHDSDGMCGYGQKALAVLDGNEEK